ncbi:MAG: DUF4097 family beta strand repeat-containing protein [Thermoanaerobaculia bacterium]
MSPKPSRNLLRLALAAAIAAVACYAPERRAVVWEASWSAAPIRRVEIEGHNGRIEIEAADVDAVRVEARIRTHGDGRDPAKLVEAKLVGETLHIREKKGRGSVSIFPFRFGSRTQIDFAVVVPERMEVVAETVNGRLQIEGVGGPMELASVNGGIQLTTPGAPVKATTVNGSIRAAFGDRFRGAQLRTVNGSIAVEVPKDASLDLDIQQVNGSFRTDLPVVVESSGRSGTRGSLHGGQYPLRIDTVNGSVKLVQGSR